MEQTVRYRLDNDLWRTPLPHDWYTVAGYVATNDCAQVGERLALIDPGGRAWDVLVADCGGADGGARWMTDNNIAVELDWRLWQKWTALHARPMRATLWGCESTTTGTTLPANRW
jgi:hypothetical protein